MNKKFDYTPLIRYTDYAEKKYIKPEKAGDLKEDMELFRENGQEARKIFTQIAKSLEEKLDDFHVQKVSSWMNQAQIARPFLWVFFPIFLSMKPTSSEIPTFLVFSFLKTLSANSGSSTLSSSLLKNTHRKGLAICA